LTVTSVNWKMITGSSVALYNGNAHVQSQWERAF